MMDGDVLTKDALASEILLLITECIEPLFTQNTLWLKSPRRLLLFAPGAAELVRQSVNSVFRHDFEVSRCDVVTHTPGAEILLECYFKFCASSLRFHSAGDGVRAYYVDCGLGDFRAFVKEGQTLRLKSLISGGFLSDNHSNFFSVSDKWLVFHRYFDRYGTEHTARELVSFLGLELFQEALDARYSASDARHGAKYSFRKKHKHSKILTIEFTINETRDASDLFFTSNFDTRCIFNPAKPLTAHIHRKKTVRWCADCF